ncbi:MAG: GHKL domain-containing protein [Eubacteriales bacterium]|nr:GHKL domain-containing protein [Eubacteriales bacterium]
MNEILWNQMAVTVPIHFFAYAPFLNHLRWGKKKTFTLVAVLEVLYLLLFRVLLQAGVSLSVIQFIAMPVFGILFFVSVKMEPGKIMFLYLFAVAYLLAVRGCASFLGLVFFEDTTLVFYSWVSGLLSLALYLLTMPFMLWYFKRTAQMVVETDAPQVWNKAWLLPLFNTLIVLLFTYAPDSASDINGTFLLARIFLIICMFLTYYFVLNSIRQLQKQTAAEEHARYLKQLADMQAAQYELLRSRMDETRKARHDLRQHLRALQGYIDQKNLEGLASYVRLYGESIPSEALHDYCHNYAVDSVIGFYAEKAANAGIAMEISFCPLPEPFIPDPELCVLLGNLLENALDACRAAGKEPSAKAPVITVRARKAGGQALAITVDNPSPAPPSVRDGQFLSSKHEGFGTGTASVKSIAQRYEGDARFEWKDGMFLVSVLLKSPRESGKIE